MLQYVAAFECIAVCCSVLQYVAVCYVVCCSVVQGISVCCSVLQCAAVRRGVLQYVVNIMSIAAKDVFTANLLQCVAVCGCCSVL